MSSKQKRGDLQPNELRGPLQQRQQQQEEEKVHLQMNTILLSLSLSLSHILSLSYSRSLNFSACLFPAFCLYNILFHLVHATYLPTYLAPFFLFYSFVPKEKEKNECLR